MLELEQRIFALTRALIALPSESSGAVGTAPNPERLVCAHLDDLCCQAGLSGERQEVYDGRQNFILRLPRQGRPRLLLVAHMDTVSGSGMTEPFSPLAINDRIYGRGACDDKGPLACVLATLLYLVGRNTPLAYDIVFAATVDEECTLGGARALADVVGPFDLCIGLEPTGLRIINAHKGVYRFTVTTKGTAVHSSHPEQGENAIIAMLPIIADLERQAAEYAREPETSLGRPTLAITMINGGASGNIIPDLCSITVDVRIMPGIAMDTIRRQMRQLVGERGSISEQFVGDGIQTRTDIEPVRALASCIGAEGKNPVATVAAYATDCSMLHQNGPCIVWGPGNIAQAHSREEYIEQSELAAAGRILAGFLTAGNC